MEKRKEYFDYIKGIIIFLMVMFHIHYIDLIKPITPFIYAFHMPFFLFFSGLFIKTDKNINVRFYRLFRSLLIPYLFFELIYIISLYLAGRLGFSFQNSISNIGASLLFYKLFINPIGAYWYLHTLIICMLITYLVDHYFKNSINSIIIIGLIFFMICQVIDGLKFENCLFFIIGYSFQKFNITIPLSIFSIFPFILIGLIYFETIKRGSIESFGLVLFSISFLGCIFTKSNGLLFSQLVSHVGRNTLIIVLLHPIFLNLFRVFYKMFLIIDDTGLLYTIIATTFTIIFSILCSILFDKLNISKILFGKDIYVPFKARALLTKTY